MQLGYDTVIRYTWVMAAGMQQLCIKNCGQLNLCRWKQVTIDL